MLLSGFGMSKAFLLYWITLCLINGKKVSIPKALCVSHCWVLLFTCETPLNQTLCNLKSYCKLDVFSSSALYTCCTYRTSLIWKPLKPEPLNLYLVPRVFSLCATWQLGINVCSIFIVINYIHISVLIITRYITV